ncbi:MAG: transposase [Duodenibacillus sp.]|nr:transposase [Duodenibacillus sp.]
MRYSEEFKNNVVSRLLAGEVSTSQAKTQYGISCDTLRAWRKAVLEEAGADSCPKTSPDGIKPAMKKLRLPANISYLQAYEAVAAQRLLSETEFGAHYRKTVSYQVP